MRTTLLRSTLCALALALLSGCSSLYSGSPGRAWSQIAEHENEQQFSNSSPQGDGQFYSFGAP